MKGYVASAEGASCVGGSGDIPKENLKFRCLEMLFSAFSSQTFEMDIFYIFAGSFHYFKFRVKI